MRTSALFGAKTSDFFIFMVCPHGHRGVQPARIFYGQGEGYIFRDIAFFYGWPRIVLKIKMSRLCSLFFSSIEPGNDLN